MDDHRVALNVIEAPPQSFTDDRTTHSPKRNDPSRAEAACVVPVILCGGTGSRLWPLSREGSPKQFWPLISDRSMLQDTALRATGVLPDRIPLAAPLVIGNRDHRFVIAGQLSDAGIRDARIVLEPVGRNSAPAVAAAALIAAEQDPETVLWIMPADAIIADVDTLHQAVSVAVRAARTGRIVTFGIRPTSADTGFGYIEVGEAVPTVPDAFDVARFIEKPNAEVAATLAASNRHLCNSGMFVATAATLLAEFECHAPDVLAHIRASIARGERDADFIRPDETAFTSCPSISLDHAIAERTLCAAVVPATSAWSDVGNWGAVWAISPKDTRGNVVLGDALLEDADRCLVRTDGRLTAVVGLQDAVIVVTEDAVLALHRDHAQNVRHIVDRLKASGRGEAVLHQRVHRPWGHYESLSMKDRYQIKRIVVEPGQKLSLQKHFHRAEHWVVVAGTARVTRDHEVMLVGENESIYLPLGCVHRLENVGRIPLTLIEVQIGSYLGEDDIVRLDDDYGRGS